MIKYTFMYNLKNNSFIFKLPEDVSTKYGTPVEKSLEKLTFTEMQIEERKEVNFGTENKLYITRCSKLLIIGCIATREKQKRSVYTFINEIYLEIKKDKAFNKNIKNWILLEIGAHNNGERMDATEKLKAKTDLAQNKVKTVTKKAEAQKEQLVRIDEQVKDMKDNAKEFRDTAVAVYMESWWYNNKMAIAMYGGFILIGVCIVIYIVNLFL